MGSIAAERVSWKKRDHLLLCQAVEISFATESAPLAKNQEGNGFAVGQFPTRTSSNSDRLGSDGVIDQNIQGCQKQIYGYRLSSPADKVIR